MIENSHLIFIDVPNKYFLWSKDKKYRGNLITCIAPNVWKFELKKIKRENLWVTVTAVEMGSYELLRHKEEIW